MGSMPPFQRRLVVLRALDPGFRTQGYGRDRTRAFPSMPCQPRFRHIAGQQRSEWRLPASMFTRLPNAVSRLPSGDPRL